MTLKATVLRTTKPVPVWTLPQGTAFEDAEGNFGIVTYPASDATGVLLWRRGSASPEAPTDKLGSEEVFPTEATVTFRPVP